MADVLEGKVLINGTDIWTEYGAFLAEEKRGGMDNLTEILKASKVKEYVGVDLREEAGKRYADALNVMNEERDVTLHFAIMADTKADWLTKYMNFIRMLKYGNNGWLSIRFTDLKYARYNTLTTLTLRMFYQDCAMVKPLTYLWNEGKHAARFKVRFREPLPLY